MYLTCNTRYSTLVANQTTNETKVTFFIFAPAHSIHFKKSIL
jgi:hypothetical protein